MKGKQKKIMSKIIIIFIMILTVDMIVPFVTSNANVFASVTEWLAKNVFNAISEILVKIADIVIINLQKIFIGDDVSFLGVTLDEKMRKNLENILLAKNIDNNAYIIKYSPGIIFSGTIPAFNVNFMKKEENVIVHKKKTRAHIVGEWSTEKLNEEITFINPYGEIKIIERIGLKNEEKIIKDDGFEGLLSDLDYYYKKENNEVGYGFEVRKDDYIPQIKYVWEHEGSWYVIRYTMKDVSLERRGEFDIDSYIEHYAVLFHIGISDRTETELDNQIANSEEEIVIVNGKTSATKIKNTVSTWYNIMKNIALVGLLSVLVYVSIRIIISSSTEDKAKYKKMLGDWLVAICILFLLHYLMALTCSILEVLCDIFNSGVIGKSGEDILMSSIRTAIENGGSFIEQFANIIIYLVLVILTCIFTYQYIKRFIYIAFLTMIAPLIALTYPLDKLKDGQAQAYTTWLREYVFMVLIQAVHLVVYYILLGVSTDLLDGSNPEVYNPIYAIAAISFIMPAEKFVRNMFGFNKAEATNNMGAALGGAALMNAINGMGKKSSKGSKGKGEESRSGDEKEDKSKVRTSSSQDGDAYDALRDKPDSNGNDIAEGIKPNEQQKGKRSIKNGAWNVAKKYVLNKKSGMAFARGAGKVAGAAALGTLGLAAGIASGDEKNVIAGLTGGIAAGKRVGAGLVDGGANLVQGTTDGINGVKDTFGEGFYGEDEYAKMKANKEFQKTSEYKKLAKDYKGQEGDIEAFVNAGITDAGKMGTALKGIQKGDYNAQEAIAYMKMAEKCPEEILYDTEKFKEYLKARDIPEGKAEQIRKGIVAFK